MSLEARLLAFANAVAADIKAINARVVVTINDAVTATTSTWSSSKVNAAITEAVANVVGAAPAALDTLLEIATQLTADESAAAALTNAVGLRVRVDAAQVFTAPQQTQGRANIGAQDASLIGNADQDLVAAYTAAKA